METINSNSPEISRGDLRIRNELNILERMNKNHKRAMSANNALAHWLVELNEEKASQLANTKLNAYCCFEIDKWNEERTDFLDWSEANYDFMQAHRNEEWAERKLKKNRDFIY